MTTVINSNGQLVATNDRDVQLMFLTKQVDNFLNEREKKELFNNIGISEKCLLVAFVMWLKDNNKLQ